ncbi:hypothetical protein LOZ12_006423 [Ophidiomyces ophidiicola]|uniref:Uncharacterized protein n=1 Tax=Ophidiomyces ophidiicola TaxID=1387563 RepID=A0ACB8UPQ0_9EURO|nr:hypothetical protein LOZ64_006510 [Ophidiomyces ophidiicola]KAI1935847.1 hypothetical protein LOZ62_005849 [Ophidiomyces ophidiicola]KAI1963826.1 hypothetical protein LOZ56_006315 [Ophidiomyces ophidiicola]KAI2007977.1 hypothetical protein LOZ50_002210 [Ophidiomyces ophidiicola]KAI2008114.1 hypothetical protein LOZ46_006685 [Ophidiomyces ophidiicola]
MGAGDTTSLCRFQAFFIQWFTSADALWNFCMACNVYLVLFRRYSLPELRKLEWKYAILCYGLQFVPALVFLFIKTASRGRIYGDAIFWCWIGRPWGFLRLSVYYGPVWFSILFTLSVYTAAGIKIIVQERRLKSISISDQLISDSTPWDASVDLQLPDDQQAGRIQKNHQEASLASGPPSITQNQGSPENTEASHEQYPASFNENIFAAESSRQVRESSLQSQQYQQSGSNRVSAHSRITDVGGSSQSTMDQPTQNHPEVPLQDRDDVSLGSLLELTEMRRRRPSETRTIADREREMNVPPELITNQLTQPETKYEIHRKASDKRKGARAYAKFASIYFVSLIVTWIPATSNRVYIYLHPDHPKYGLLMAAAIGLPLQGFWNGVIYFITSINAVKAIYKTLSSRKASIEALRGKWCSARKVLSVAYGEFRMKLPWQ